MSAYEIIISITQQATSNRKVTVSLKKVVGHGTGIDTEAQLLAAVEELSKELDMAADKAVDVIYDLNG